MKIDLQMDNGVMYECPTEWFSSKENAYHAFRLLREKDWFTQEFEDKLVAVSGFKPFETRQELAFLKKPPSHARTLRITLQAFGLTSFEAQETPLY